MPEEIEIVHLATAIHRRKEHWLRATIRDVEQIDLLRPSCPHEIEPSTCSANNGAQDSPSCLDGPLGASNTQTFKANGKLPTAALRRSNEIQAPYWPYRSAPKLLCRSSAGFETSRFVDATGRYQTILDSGEPLVIHHGRNVLFCFLMRHAREAMQRIDVHAGGWIVVALRKTADEVDAHLLEQDIATLDQTLSQSALAVSNKC